MAISSDALTTKVAAGSPYQLSSDQVSRASSALLRHVKDEEKKRAEESTTKNLLADNDDSDSETGGDAVPVWLILTTKKHIVDKNRLKPGKIPVPHSLCSSSTLSICLITADPQRAVKDVVSDPAFPSHLSSRITRVIGLTKLKERYKSFESRRQLLSEHDMFLADDRIIMRLVKTLGKIFYKSSKRPIPVRIEEIQKVGGKKVKKDDKKRPLTDEPYSAVASPDVVAKEIERTLNSVPVHLAPAATAAVRVGLSTFTPQQLTENIDAVVGSMTEKYVTKGWKNVKALHIKGPNTMALPVWLASELWVDDQDVKEEVEGADVKTIEGAKSSGKKRKSTESGAEGRRSKKSKPADEDEDEEAELISSRRKKLKDQKAKALSETADGSIEAVSAAAGAEKPSKSSKKKKKSAA